MLLKSDKSLGLMLTIDGTPYTVEKLRPGLDRWAVLLRNHDSGKQYRLAEDFDGHLHCQCKAYQFSRQSPHTCKHCSSIRELLQLAKEITS